MPDIDEAALKWVVKKRMPLALSLARTGVTTITWYYVAVFMADIVTEYHRQRTAT